MEGWRQRRPGSSAKTSWEEKLKTDLTLTGLLMEGLGRRYTADLARAYRGGEFVVVEGRRSV